MREKLIELIASKVCDSYSPTCDEWQPHNCGKCYANDCRIADLVDHLIANGVTIPVRCGECKHFHHDDDRLAQHCMLFGAMMEGDDFCSCGEREKDEC